MFHQTKLGHRRTLSAEHRVVLWLVPDQEELGGLLNKKSKWWKRI